MSRVGRVGRSLLEERTGSTKARREESKGVRGDIYGKVKIQAGREVSRKPDCGLERLAEGSRLSLVGTGSH